MYSKSVPILRHYVAQIGVILELAADAPESLEYQVYPDVFAAGRQLAIALGFALRATYPVCGKDLPEMKMGASDLDSLREWHKEVTEHLSVLTLEDYAAAANNIPHKAGFAVLNQTPEDYVQLFAMPNFFFHMAAGYTGLRAAGLPISKSHFDGLHEYPVDFSF